MIAQNFEYSAPAKLSEALQLLSSGEAKALAGGMSLIPLMKLRLATPEQLVDISRIPDLNYIRRDFDGNGKDVIRIGATTTHYDVESSALLRASCPLLHETATNIGDIQVRNRGTIGGSIAHADPAADYPAALLALEARVILASAKSEREMPIVDFFVDTFTTALEPGELIREVIVPFDDASTGTSYQKVPQPASGFAIVGIAARVRKVGGRVTFARIGVTGLAGKPYRAINVEQALEGTAGSPSDIQKAAALVADGVEANSDLHASESYRKHLASVYTMRALAIAFSRTA
ncbi:MAG: xanthine dehydrogenase family protein subunit M [Bryobacteraceae bacterium]